MSTAPGQHIDETALGLFEVLTQLSLATQPHPRRRVELKEFEFLTLSVLRTHSTMIVGDIQRLLGVLPAQMSRIIRSLENREAPLIECQINSQDKRKIDVRLTPAGEQALLEYQEVRVTRLGKVLQALSEEECEELGRWIQRLRELMRDAKSVDADGVLVRG